MTQGGSSGPAVIPGDAAKSLLVRAVKRENEETAMPPGDPLSEDEVQILVKWIQDGAPWPSEAASARPDDHGITVEERAFWSFQPLGRPAAPKVEGNRNQHPIDAFVAAKHRERGLTPVERSSSRVLLRRLSYDLIGLPPTPEEIDEFAARSKSDWNFAVRNEIDRLLASRHYGERWAQHWLDLVRYADTAGDASDFPVPEAWKYRNYVINAFNEDKPYDQFVREQIAGDLMPADDEAETWNRTVATGYVALSRRVGVGPKTHIVIEDTLNNLGKTFLGLTVGCARCHDHKFDPIQASDYYALYGIFQSTVYPHAGSEHSPHRRDFVYRVGTERANELLASHQPELDRLRKKERATLERYRDLQRKPESELGYNRAEAWQKLLDVRDEVRQFAETIPHLETAFAVSEGEPEDAHVQEQGDPKKKGQRVPRRFLQVLGGQPIPDDVDASGRLQLADWIASSDNPLTARVIANRIWHYHFGRGLVASTSDFGVRGERPTHPQMLDFLASHLIDNDWSIKSLHRLILTSRTWQRSSQDAPKSSAIDPENVYLWRGNRRRLDAEQLRDSVLKISGQLDKSVGKAHPFPHRLTYFYRQHEPFVGDFASDRRSVYLFRQRIRKNRYLDLFDGPDGNLHLGKRRPTTTSLQSLYLLNSEFLAAQAQEIAKLVTSTKSESDSRIRWAYEYLFSRTPTNDEIESVSKHLSHLETKVQSEAAWSQLVHSMLCSNEFLYVD